MFWFELPYSLPPPPKSRSKDSIMGRLGTISPVMIQTGGGVGIVPSPLGFGLGQGGGLQGGGVGVPLVRISDDALAREKERERPGLVMTDSEMPLLPEAHGGQLTPSRRMSKYFQYGICKGCADVWGLISHVT
jgi:hypothetical protein